MSCSNEIYKNKNKTKKRLRNDVKIIIVFLSSFINFIIPNMYSTNKIDKINYLYTNYLYKSWKIKFIFIAIKETFLFLTLAMLKNQKQINLINEKDNSSHTICVKSRPIPNFPWTNVPIN